MVTGEKRQQLSWFLTLVIVAIVSFVAGGRPRGVGVLGGRGVGVWSSNQKNDISFGLTKKLRYSAQLDGTKELQ